MNDGLPFRLQESIEEKQNEAREKIAVNMGEILEALGIDYKNDSSIVDTPNRVAKFLQEFNQGTDLKQLLKARFECDSKGMVVQTGIPFRALCEHHLLPFLGVAHVGYIPNKWVVGLSKLTRLVQSAGTRRPSIQERLTKEICSLLSDELDCLGAIVVINAEHTCMSVRGINAPGVRTITSSVKGVFRDVPAAREEFFALIR